MSQSSDSSDQDIPILTDVMETGHEPHAKAKRPKRSGSHGHEGAHTRKHGAHGAHDTHGSHDVHEAPHELQHDAQRDAHAEPQTLSFQDDDVPVLDSIYESPHPPVREPAQFVPGEAEFTSGSTAEQYVAPPEPVAMPTEPVHAPAAAPAHASDYDADVLAERLRGRFATYLKGDGRNLIEARCRDAFQDHTTWLVNQITREVALALETEMLSWVREAIREELGNSTTSK